VPELVQVAREPLEGGIIVGGELREPELLADALRAFFRKHKLPRQGVRLGIANNRIGVRILEIAGIDDPKQLENAIRYRAQEALPIPIEEAVLDFHVLGERVDDEGQRVRRVLLVVAYRELIDRYVTACKKAGVRLAGIDLEAFALLRALGEPKPEDDRPPTPRSSSSRSATTAPPSPSRTAARASSRACSTGAARPSTSRSRASSTVRLPRPSRSSASSRSRPRLARRADPGTGRSRSRGREAPAADVRARARLLAPVLPEPARISGIGEIVITGGTAQLGGIADELQRLIGVRVAVGDPLMRVKVGKKVRETEQLGSLSVAIGLGIED
jgi:type IV pilus assembly protein PilM